MSIPERFEQVVRNHPGRVAVSTRDKTLTFETLNNIANRLGRSFVQRLGRGSEPIALFFENGIDLISALLGALKAGKYFVAIDVSFPSSRIAYILETIQTRLIVTNNKNWESITKLVDFSSYHGSCLNIDAINSQSDEGNLGLRIPNDSIATIVFTSGSTGQPKGIAKTHEYCLERADFNIKFLSVNFNDKLSLLHSICFGSGEINLYASLLSGASLLPFDVKTEGISQLTQWLQSEKISVLHCAPSLFRQLVDQLRASLRFPNLRLIHLSGSPINQSDFERYKKHFSTSAKFAFHMGATEAGCIACAVVDGSFSFPKRGTPAGFPPENKSILILDEIGHEVEKGEIGEIAVKSKYLAQGYWKNPELTKEKFLSDPSGGQERIYFTGDLGQILPSGLLVHLGRKDSMVKIRGYRVELGEVERALLEHPNIREVGVVAWKGHEKDTYLAAYLISRAEPRTPVEEISSFLNQKLPDYMVPLTFMYLDSLPLTNGKLDRNLLPRPGHKRPNLITPYAPPESALEKHLVKIWENILDVRPIGIRDRFFDLGGDSLSAMRLVSRVVENFKVEIPLRSLFVIPTVAAMAVVIAENLNKKYYDRKLASVLEELESLSEDEAQRRLNNLATVIPVK